MEAKQSETKTPKVFRGNNKSSIIQVIMNSNMLEVHTTLPEGVTVSETKYGNGLFATKKFPKDSVMFEPEYFEVEEQNFDYVVFIKDPNNGNKTYRIECNSIVNGVYIGNNIRQIFPFTGLTNHSCEANCWPISEDKEKKTFVGVATRDINAGEEITMDYFNFDWDCSDRLIENCQCNSSFCLGRVDGFKYLPIEEKKKRINLVADDILIEWVNECGWNPENPADNLTRECVIYDVLQNFCPPGIEIIENNDFNLVATKFFPKNSLVLSNKSIFVPENIIIIVRVGATNKWLDTNDLCVKRGNSLLEYFGFDSFMERSNDPNVKIVYRSDNSYEKISIKDIYPGEKLTCSNEGFPPLEIAEVLTHSKSEYNK